MSSYQMVQLRQHLEVVHTKFEELYQPDAGDRFAMEIEFKITSENKLAIKQARPWVFGPNDRNTPPRFALANTTRTVLEHALPGAEVGEPVIATDPQDPTLRYELSGSSLFTVDDPTGQIRVATGATLTLGDTHAVTLTASDPSGLTDTTAVAITVVAVNDPPVARDDTVSTEEDTALSIGVLGNDSDPENDPLTVLIVSSPTRGTATVTSDNRVSYQPNRNTNGTDTFTYHVSDGQTLSNIATASVTISPVNDAPVFALPHVLRSVAQNATAGTNVGAPATATDVGGDELSYKLSGGGALFEIELHTAQIRVAVGAVFDLANQPEHILTVTASDPSGARTSVTVTVTVAGSGPITLITFIPSGGGGGGPPPGPQPSEVDFEWNVTRDIEALDSEHDTPTGAWSHGTTLWLAENGDGADDALYASDLATGERVVDLEFELDETNRAPRGLWSVGETMWVSDSGQDKLFAHDLETGERLLNADIELAERNRDPRAIWSDGTTIWVLDGRADALFAYDLATGEFLAGYDLDDANSDPRGIWSDGVTVWVSDHGAKRLFAYRLPAPEGPAAEDADALPLERVRDEEFTELSRASNNSPRGIWSGGGLMYVADGSDGKVYSYNLPDAIDASLASLALSGIEFGEFDSGTTEYEGVASDGVTATTVEAEAAQPGATVTIAPADADEATDGHQLRLEGVGEITVTVTSADESRTKAYQVRFGEAGPSATCLRGAITVGFSLLVYEGGGLEELESCAQGRHVTAIYALHEGEYVSYILGAPEFVNSAFRELYAGGVPALTPLTARSEGPPTADPAAGGEVTEPWPLCLRGAIAEGFSLVLYEGGSIEDLDACAKEAGLAALYVVDDGVWVSYILGAPEFVNARFRELFTDGLPGATPLVGKTN